jgi:hypothetical protein
VSERSETGFGSWLSKAVDIFTLNNESEEIKSRRKSGKGRKIGENKEER